MEQTNYYETLGLAETADPALIRVAYRAAMKKDHPDQGGNGGRAKALNEAYAVLSDPTQRADHDRELAEARRREEAQRQAKERAAAQAQAQAQARASTVPPSQPRTGPVGGPGPTTTATRPPAPEPVPGDPIYANHGFQVRKHAQEAGAALKIALWIIFAIGGLLTFWVALVVVNVLFPEFGHAWRWPLQLLGMGLLAVLIAMPIRSWRKHLHRKARADFGLYR